MISPKIAVFVGMDLFSSPDVQEDNYCVTSCRPSRSEEIGPPYPAAGVASSVPVDEEDSIFETLRLLMKFKNL
jgi:hypothetical protein